VVPVDRSPFRSPCKMTVEDAKPIRVPQATTRVGIHPQVPGNDVPLVALRRYTASLNKAPAREK